MLSTADLKTCQGTPKQWTNTILVKHDDAQMNKRQHHMLSFSALSALQLPVLLACIALLLSKTTECSKKVLAASQLAILSLELFLRGFALSRYAGVCNMSLSHYT